MSKNILLLCIVISGFWLLVSGASQAQDQAQPNSNPPSIVDNVIQQMQNGSGNNAPTTVIAPNGAAPVMPNPDNAAQQPGPIPGIVAEGDNTQLPAIPEPPPTWDAHPSVILRALDKVTARTQTFTIPIGQQFNFGALTIAVRACRARPPLEPADAAAFLQIVEQKKGEELVARFSGWMFSSSPSLSALEHPVYDVWVVGCGNEVKR